VTPVVCAVSIDMAQVTWSPEVEPADRPSLLMRFALEYTRYHGYISVVVCVLMLMLAVSHGRLDLAELLLL